MLRFARCDGLTGSSFEATRIQIEERVLVIVLLHVIELLQKVVYNVPSHRTKNVYKLEIANLCYRVCFLFFLDNKKCVSFFD